MGTFSDLSQERARLFRTFPDCIMLDVKLLNIPDRTFLHMYIMILKNVPWHKFWFRYAKILCNFLWSGSHLPHKKNQISWNVICVFQKEEVWDFTESPTSMMQL